MDYVGYDSNMIKATKSFLVPAVMPTRYNDPCAGGESKRDMQAKMEFPIFCFSLSGLICVDVSCLPGNRFSEMR